MDDSIKDIIQAKYTSYYNDDSDYPDVSTIEKSSVFPRPRATFSSELLVMIKEQSREESSEQKEFIMKKFRGIKGVISTQPKRSQSGRKADSTSEAAEKSSATSGRGGAGAVPESK